MTTDSPEQAPVRLIQLTDCHLFADPSSTLSGLNCNDSLDAVLRLVREKHGNEFDAFICTGDLVQDGSESGYRTLVEKLADFDKPYHWLCGNHDNRRNMVRVLGERNEVFVSQVDYGAWQLVLLDTQVPGKIHGFLQQGELDTLRLLLQQSASADMHALVSLHHNPLAVEAAWLQRHSLQNPGQFFEAVDEFDHVRGIVHGHIHQDIAARRKGIPVWSTPSTCIQFHPGNDHFTIDHKQPGYRWLELHADGHVETGVERTTETLYVDFDSTGY